MEIFVQFFYAWSLWTSRTQWGWKIYMDEAFNRQLKANKRADFM